jgi:ABC-2 type transport system permease protein
MNKRNQAIIRFIILIGILIAVNIISRYFYGYFDLTQDKRFTITQPTKNLVNDIEDKVFVEVYLTGDNLTSNYRQLQEATITLLDQFRDLNSNVDYQFVNPNEGTTEEINQMRERLNSLGIVPIATFDNKELSKKAIYPFATIRKGERVTSVGLLQGDASLPETEMLNNSINLLEYNFAVGFKSLNTVLKPSVLFLEGHGELSDFERADLEQNLKLYYVVQAARIDSILTIDAKKIDVLIVAKPRYEFPEQDKFKIDQFVMNGGKVIWLLDKLAVNIDSLRRREAFVPMEQNLNLDNLLFKYGVRVNNDLALDLENTKIPQVVGQQGGKPQFELFPWFYHPTVSPASEHPIVKNLDLVNLFFPTTIDTIQTSAKIKKTILLSTSERSRIQRPPVRLTFEILKYKPQIELFNKGKLPLAVLLEGEFPSAYKGRVSPEMMAGLQQLGQPFKESAAPGAMQLVVSDGDIARNFVDYRSGKFQPLGLNPFDRKLYANKAFLLNTLDYMLDDAGITAARMKEVKLRLLDTAKVEQEKTKWQVINIVIPLAFLIVFGLLFNYLRHRRYAN